jgi:tetratricopeptide (TPR) repeat protein
MLVEISIVIAVILMIGWLVMYMRAQKLETSVEQLIEEHRYAEAAAIQPNDSAGYLHRGEALKLLGRFEEAIDAYKQSDDPAAREGIALSLAHLRRDLDAAKKMMEETIALYPQIQEFQALDLAYILLRAGDREGALRVFRDNIELLETRFRDDYTDPDPLLAETLILFAALAEANGDDRAAGLLRARAADWAPGSVWARARIEN